MSLSTDQQNALDLHNSTRAAVGVGPMQWDSNLQAQAQQWANYLAQINNLQHDPNAGAGENIASEPNSDDVLTHSTRDWASEVNGYTYGPCDGSSGHYTQIVWANTTRVGIAVAISAGGQAYVVGRYSPQGNVIGQYPYPAGGVPPPGGNGPGGVPTRGPQFGPNGLVLVNAFNGNQTKSGIAWYKQIGNCTGYLPDAYIDVDINGRITWEGQTIVSPAFPDGDTLTWNIQGNAQSLPFETQCGNANNKYQSFLVFKDDQHVVWQQDGWQYETIYWCQ